MFSFPLFSCQGGDGGPQGCRNMRFEEQNPLGAAHDRGGHAISQRLRSQDAALARNNVCHP